MDIEKFTEELVRLLKEKTGPDVQVQSSEVIKLNDRKLHAVNICPSGGHICRNFYAETCFEDYQNGATVETIAEKMLACAKDDKTYQQGTKQGVPQRQMLDGIPGPCAVLSD